MHTPNIYPHMHAHHMLVHKHIHMYICTTLLTHNSHTHNHTHTHACEYAHTKTYPSHVCLSHTLMHMHMHTYPTHIQHVCIYHTPSTYPTYSICTSCTYTYVCVCTPITHSTQIHKPVLFTCPTYHTRVYTCILHHCFLSNLVFSFQSLIQYIFPGLFVSDLPLLHVSCMRAK